MLVSIVVAEGFVVVIVVVIIAALNLLSKMEVHKAMVFSKVRR